MLLSRASHSRHFLVAFVACAVAVAGTFSSSLSSSSSPAQGNTSGGIVIGIRLPGNSGGVAVDQFLGIPFAHAERFQPPADFTGKYPGVLSATKWGPACLQVGTPPEAIYGSEDCLRANVWRPATARLGSKLPVMVFIFGGSNQFGEAEPYNMSALAAFHDVVCVSFNYRTGPLGWMAFQEDEEAGRSTGNWGILDIQSALRWVKREIASFGGDMEKVAIHGQSSGGGLVELQYVTPGSSGLFQGAISESGGLNALSKETALASGVAVAAALGCLTAGGSADKTCVTAAPAEKIVATTYSNSWGPSVDGVTIPMQPQLLLQAGQVNNATVVLGAQTNDSNLFLFRQYTKDGLDQPNNRSDGALTGISPLRYKLVLGALVGAQLLPEAVRLYPADDQDHVQNVHLLGTVESDQMHCHGRHRASLLNRKNPGRAFVYRFDYWYTSNPECQAVPNYHLPYLGAAHQDEVTFVLGQPNFMEDGSCCGVWGLTTADCPHLQRCEACYAPNRFGADGYLAYFDEKEWAFTRKVGTFWTNVAATGNPNCRTEGQCTDAWPQFTGGGTITQNIVLNASLPNGHLVESTIHGRPEICAFWDAVRSAESLQLASEVVTREIVL